MRLPLLLLLGLLLSCSACKKNDTTVTPQAATRKAVLLPVTEPAVPLTAPLFLSQPIPTTVIETTNEALPIWRNFAKNRPALVIAANTPAVFSVPDEYQDELGNLLKSTDDKELIRRSSPDNPDPLFLPVMSLAVALDAGWFSQIVWIFPSKLSPEQLDLGIFKQQLLDAQIASPDEAESFTLNNGSFSGIVRGRPFTAAHVASLPPLDASALLHIDADYFKPLYAGEIKTPLYPLMVDLLNKIKERSWKIAAATVALSNRQFDGLPLQTRFLGKDLATVLQDPQMLEETFPHQWELRSNALYLENFIQREEIRQIYLEMEKEDPGDPAVKFGLYHISRQLNKTDDALDYLREAVQLDKVYAGEYLSLSELAMEKKRPEQAVKMVQLARSAEPENPFILLQLVRALLNTGQQEEAKALKAELTALIWSKIYYPEQSDETVGLLSLLQ